jgi:hypothetical protein
MKKHKSLKKLVLSAAAVALMSTLTAAPALAQGDVENQSGDIETENSFSIEGNNNNACLGLSQFNNSGNFSNQQRVGQFRSIADDIELNAPEITFAPENETQCDQAVQQSAAASS